MVELKKITVSDQELIQEFLNEAGDSLLTFRYFDSRPISILNNHVITFMAFDEGCPVGYGHLDKENDRVWLGVAVSERTRGMGIGKKIVVALLDYADTKAITKVCLTVDASNTNAIKLYENHGFLLEKKLSEGRYLMYRSYEI